MSIKIQHYIIITLVLTAIGYGVGRYLQPAEVITKEVQVVKEVEVVKRDVKTVIREVTRTDGTKETTTTIEDRTKETTKKKQESESSTVIVAAKPQWRVQGLVGLDNFTVPKYGVDVERRILGPFSAGVFVMTNRQADTTIGASVSFEF